MTPIINNNSIDIYRKKGPKVFFVNGILGFLIMTFAGEIGPDSWWVIVLPCICSILLFGYFLYVIFANSGANIVAETGLYLILSYLVYSIFGPLLYVIGPDDGAEFSRSWYQINASESVWLIGLNALGLSIAGLAYCLARFSTISKVASNASASWCRFSPDIVFWFLLSFGFIAKYLFVLPYELGLTQEIPDSAVRQLGRLLIIAIILGNANRNSTKMVFIANVIVFLEVISGLLMFNKTETLLAFMAALIGRYLKTKNAKTLIISAVSIITLFVFIGPIVTFGRNELLARGGGAAVGAGLLERWEITKQYFDTDSQYRSDGQISGLWWSRLNYLPSQQSAIDLYEKGNGGKDIYLIPFIFVPRALYPEKPEMTVSGVDLTEKVAHHRLSSTGIGVFVDGFYNLGWVGFFIASLTYGLVLRIYAEISKAIIKFQAFAMYPMVFMGIFVGLRIDGWWLTDVAGPLIFSLILLFIYRLTSK